MTTTTAGAGKRARVRVARLRSLLLGLIALTTAAAGTACANDGDQPRVVVTTNILGDITREIVGDEAEVTVLMKPDADPHSFGLSAVQAAELERADLVVFNGTGWRRTYCVMWTPHARPGWPPSRPERLSTRSPSTRATTEARGRRRGNPTPLLDRPRPGTQGLGADRRPGGRARRWCGRARDTSQRHPLRQATDRSHRLDGEVLRPDPADKRALVTNHHVFGYLADRFGFRVIGAVIPSGTTLASPSSSDLRTLTRAMEEAGVRTVFADSSQPNKLAEVLRTELGGRVSVVELYSESLTRKSAGAGTYLQMMRANTTAMTDGLTGG